VAGVVAALAHKLANPTSMMPMVGASGAIAGAMGAFLVSYARTRIRFVYWLFLRPGTFTAPAYVMLPLWLVTQVLWGLVDAGDGVAYWAHVGGFVFGLGFGGVLRATGWERKLDEAVEATVSRVQDGRLVEAGDMISAGRVPEAIALLEKLAAEKPASVDVQLEMARAARAAGDVARIVRTQMRLVDLYFSSNMVDTAIEVYGEVQAAHQEEQLPRAWRASTADRFVFVGRPDRADALWSSLLRSGITDAIAVRVALAKARLLLQGGRHAEARDLVEAARACPACEGELAVAAAAVLAQLPPPH
jgi:tetratricopeptide (TPR) repeat protein